MKPRVKSWDLYDTLIAKRNNSETDVFRIAENAGKVLPTDIIVSDMWMSAERLRELSGFNNRMFVSDFGKGNGKIWPTVQVEYQIELHTGDNVGSDFASPRRHRIPAQLTTVADATDIERVLQLKFPGLSKVMREARLITWSDNPDQRARQLLQIEANLPLLFLSSILLHRLDIEGTMLFSARDCWQWYKVAEAVKNLMGADSELAYFHTSRIARTEADIEYTDYFHSLNPGAIIDIGGTGYSSSVLQEKAGTDAKQIMLVEYPKHILDNYFKNSKVLVHPRENVGLLPHKPGIHLERVNLAPHQMFQNSYQQINPCHIDWMRPEIVIQNEAINIALSVAEGGHYDFTEDFKATHEEITMGMEYAYNEIYKRQECTKFAAEFLVMEDKYVMQRLQK